MSRKIFLLILFVLYNLLQAQQLEEVLGSYPKGQDFYKGGPKSLFIEMKGIIFEQNLKPCLNSEETYALPVIVKPDSTISFVKDFDSVNIAKNKCAYYMGRKIVPHLKNWVPARENNVNVSAITEILIYPFFLENFNTDIKKNIITQVKHSKGSEYFAREVRYIFFKEIGENDGRLSTLVFTITEGGNMEDLYVEGPNLTEINKKNIIRKVLQIKGKWTPATLNGVPFKEKYRQGIILLRENVMYDTTGKDFQKYMDRKFQRK